MAVSLEASIRTCKVDQSYANRVESDRFLNPASMMCNIWNGMDTSGRRVPVDTFMTKRAGCNSAEDRVVVENSLRPQYMEYINLSANGIDGAIYGSDGGSKEIYGDTMPWVESGARDDRFNYPLNKEACVNGSCGSGGACANNVNNITGNFGLQFSADVYPSCGYMPYAQAMSQQQQALRKRQALQEGYLGNYYRNASGF